MIKDDKVKQILKNQQNAYQAEGSEHSEYEEHSRQHSRSVHIGSGSKINRTTNKHLSDSQKIETRKVNKSGTHHNIQNNHHVSTNKSIFSRTNRSKTFHHINPDKQIKHFQNNEKKSNYQRNIVYNYGYNSRKGQNLDGSLKHNQDNYFMKLSFMNDKSMSLFGVMDGHGSDGHLISQFIKNHLPNNIEKAIVGNQDIKDIDQKVISSIDTAFENTASQLAESINIDSQRSGSTISMVLIVGDTAYFANLGDSRSIIINHENQEYIYSYQTEDQKPENVDERTRIEQSGGRVCPSKGQTEPLRVWLKKENIPGLAMTRSMGDFLCSSIGVINEPEIDKIHFHNKDIAIILASDGIWEFIESEQVPNMVSTYIKSNNPDKLCEYLVQEAHEQWKDSQCNIDDITIVTVFIKI